MAVSINLTTLPDKAKKKKKVKRSGSATGTSKDTQGQPASTFAGNASKSASRKFKSK
jgi:hypothetical protein